MNSLRDRLLGKAAVNPETGCWEWTGHRDRDGYGRLSISNAKRSAHRASYEIAVGPIPDGLTIDHLCRNRACINPDHMEPVTALENTRRREASAVNSSAKTYCIRGHEFTAENTRIYRGWRHCRACKRIREAGRIRTGRVRTRKAAA